MKCPKCKSECEPSGEVDIGVGIQQFGPWGCPACNWVEPIPEGMFDCLDEDIAE
jgi:hypothetical protein